ncbi:winged helix-turn-helix domain-containing protein [Nocardia sp. NPDC051030]|uniref:winged helix-turn-helix domain-containing protein n=1 Tax=Nocardia sp. NPDC051030 TaxID=3155162 RepID=UPI00342B3C40
MKRIHCTPDDLMRIRIGPPLGAIGETILASRIVQRRDAVVFDGWRRQVLGAIPENFGVLADIVPPIGGHFLDLITPTRNAQPRSMAAGIEALHLASRDEIRNEVECLIRYRAENGVQPLPTWTSELSDRDGSARRDFAAAAEAFHSVAFAGRWAHIQSYLDSAAEQLARTLATEGVERMLAALRPFVRWHAPVLEISTNAHRHDEYLDGRGLVIVPSLFACPEPVLLMSTVDTDAPHTLIVPVVHRIGDFAAAWGPRPINEALIGLLGRTRAAALQEIAEGCSTTELARQLEISPATASEHASILRAAGLIESRRYRNTMRHEVTPLGAALLDGNLERGIRVA